MLLFCFFGGRTVGSGLPKFWIYNKEIFVRYFQYSPPHLYTKILHYIKQTNTIYKTIQLKFKTTPTFAPGLQNFLVQLSRVAFVLGLDRSTGQDALGREVGLTVAIPPQFHQGQLLRGPRVHGYGSYEGDVHPQRSLCLWFELGKRKGRII